MRSLKLGFGILIIAGMAPACFADIWDYVANVGGSTYCANLTGFTSCPGGGTILSSGQTLSNVPSIVSTIDEVGGVSNQAPDSTSGLGTAAVTFNPGTTGSFNVNLLLFEELNDAYGDYEYATTGGALASGESWQVDVPDYDFAGDPNPDATGTIGANTAASTLSNTNDVPGPCPANLSGTACDFTAMALGFNFTLGTGQEELLAFTVSTSAPTSGFYIEQQDNAGSGSTPIYYSATAETCTIGVDCPGNTPPPPPPPTVPEPGSVTLLGSALAVLGWTLRSRFAAAKAS